MYAPVSTALRSLLLPLLIFCVQGTVATQSSSATGGLPEEEQDAEALARVRNSGGREALLAEGKNWSERKKPLRAISFFRAAAYDAEGSLLADSLAGLALHKTATVYYGRGKDREAAEYYRHAIAIRDALYSSPHEDRALSRSNLSNCLTYLGQLDSALTFAREANALYDALPRYDSINYLRNLSQIALVARRVLDLRLAYSATYRAVALLEELPEVTTGERFGLYHNYALAMLRLGQTEEALTYAERALEVAKQSSSPLHLPMAHNMLAIVERERGEVARGLKHLKLAEDRMGPENKQKYIAGTVYLNLAEYYGGVDDVENFELYRRRAREVFEQRDIRSFYVSEKIPEVLLKWERYGEVVETINERIAFLNLPAASGDTEANIIPLIDLLSVRARAYAATDRRTEALADYDRLFNLQNHLRDSVSTEGSRRYLSRNLRPFFDRAIALHLAEYRASGSDSCLWRAFQLSERARAYSLRSTLKHRASEISPQERRLLRRVADLERRISLGEGDRRELESARMQLDRLRYEQRASPTRSEELGRLELLKFLQENGYDLIEYHLAPEGSLVFLFTRDGKLRAFPIPDAQRLAGRVEDFRRVITGSVYRRKSLRSPARQDSLDRDFLAVGTALAEQLLPAAVRDLLHQRPRICVVPDGVLNYLPFAALPLDGAEVPLDYARVNYLQEAAELQFTYSAHYLMEVSRNESPDYAHALMAFAPSFSGQPLTGGRGSMRLRGENTFSPLSHNRAEVEALSQLVPNTVAYYGPEADRRRFLEQVGTSRVLHLSSHGNVHPTDPNLSFVAFTQEGDTVQQDEMLYFNDLYGLPLSNELTVLSACETSLGQLAVGETTMSFASAFAAAGAKSTVTTLWQVDDRATKDLIVDFYRRLVDGEDRATSLNAAQRNLRSGEYAHPFYWAGLTLYGASGPVFAAKSSGGTLSFWMIGSLLVSGLAASLLMLRRVMRPKPPAR